MTGQSDSTSPRFGMGTLILIAFVVIMVLGGAMIIWHSDALLKFVYIVPVIFLFLAITAFLLILLHYAVTLRKEMPGIPVTALGLPEGSVRAFLAIGLLALVAVFGAFLYFESKGGSYPEAGILQTDDLTTTRQILGDKFILIPDTAATEKTRLADLKKYEESKAEQKAAYDKAKAAYDKEKAAYDALNPTDKAAKQAPQEPPAPRDLTAPKPKDVFRVVSTTLDTSRADLAKQLLVMITTLLTTVVGFYFGSRSGESTPTPGDSERRATALRELHAAYQKAKPDVAPLNDRLTKLAAAAAGLADAAAKEKAQKSLQALQTKLDKANQALEEANAAAGNADAKTADLETQRKNAADAASAIASVKSALDTAKDDVTKLP